MKDVLKHFDRIGEEQGWDLQSEVIILRQLVDMADATLRDKMLEILSAIQQEENA